MKCRLVFISGRQGWFAFGIQGILGLGFRARALAEFPGERPNSPALGASVC